MSSDPELEKRLQEGIALARTGGFRVHAATYTLDQAAEVYRSMVGGTLQGRAVIVPNQS